MSPAPNAITPAAGHYRLDPDRTAVRFSTRHLFGLAAVTGTVQLRDGEVHITESLSATTLHAVIDAASFGTGLSSRDQAVRSARFLDVDLHPDIVFHSDTLVQRDDRWVAPGTLTAHGVGAPADLTINEIQIAPTGELTVRASATIDRYAHHVTAARGMAARRLTIQITASIARHDPEA